MHTKQDTTYSLPKVGIDYIVTIEGQKCLVKNDTRTYHIQKTTIDQRDNYNWLLTRLPLFQRTLSVNCNRFK